jgi:hypothetical protein
VHARQLVFRSQMGQFSRGVLTVYLPILAAAGLNLAVCPGNGRNAERQTDHNQQA